MKDSFEPSLQWFLTDEMGVEGKNDISKKGNKFGLSFLNYKQWTDLNEENFNKITKKEAQDLYYNNVWIPVSGDVLPRGLDYFMFDRSCCFSCAVVISWWKLSLNLPSTVSFEIALDIMKNKTTRDVILNIDVFVRRRLKSDALWSECCYWWTNRANRVRDRAIKYAGVNSYATSSS